MGRQLLVHLVGDSTKFDKMVGGADKKLQSLGDRANAFGNKMTKRVSLPIAAAGVAAFKMASDLNESLSATDARFGAAADGIKKWAKELDSSFGLTQRDALDMVTQLRAVTQNSKLTNEQMQTLAERAADVGSQFNMSAKEVGDRFRSAMTGSTEVLEIFGVSIKQGSQGMTDYAESLGKTVSELTEAEKQAGFYQIIMDQTSTTQGDAAKTADTAAGKMRTLKTDMANTAAEIGNKLMPAGEKLLGWLGDLMGWLDKIPGGSDTTVAALMGFALVGPVIRGVTGATKAMTVAINVSKLAAATHPFLLLAVALGTVAIAADRLALHFGLIDESMLSVKNTWKALTRQVKDFIDMVKRIPSNIPGMGVIGDVVGGIGSIGSGVGNLFRAAGGPVAAGTPYMVGERGPELFVPGRAGSIVPNHRMGGGGAGVVVNINAGTVVHERDLPRVVMDAIRAAKLVGIT